MKFGNFELNFANFWVVLTVDQAGLVSMGVLEN
jgi:hypothetical protein